MTTRPKHRDALGCLADVLVEDILETPGAELLAESAEDRQVARALSAELGERIGRLPGKFERQSGGLGSGEKGCSKDANGRSNADFFAAGRVGRSGLPRRWRSAHELSVPVHGKRMKPLIRRSHASTFDWPVDLSRSHLLARACSPRNLQVAMASMLVFAAVAISAALYWVNRTPASTGDEFTRAVSPATAPLPGKPNLGLPTSAPLPASDRAGSGAADWTLETAAGRPQSAIASPWNRR